MKTNTEKPQISTLTLACLSDSKVFYFKWNEERRCDKTLIDKRVAELQPMKLVVLVADMLLQNFSLLLIKVYARKNWLLNC